MSVQTLLNRFAKNSETAPVQQRGQDTVIYISPKVVTGVMLAVAGVAGVTSALDMQHVIKLSQFGSFACDTIFALALWFPMNHPKDKSK